MYRKSTAASVLSSFIWTTEDKKLLRKLRKNLIANELIEPDLSWGSNDLKQELPDQINSNQHKLTGLNGLNVLKDLSENTEQSKTRLKQWAYLLNGLLVFILIAGVLFALFTIWYDPMRPSPYFILGSVDLLALLFLWLSRWVKQQISFVDKSLSLLRNGISSLEDSERLAPGAIKDLEENRANARVIKASYHLFNKEQPRIDVLILTPTANEFTSVKKYLSNLDDSHHPVIKTNYTIGTIPGLNDTIKIALQETGAGNRSVRSAAELGILLFQPKMVLLVGKAAGLKDVALLDIVVGQKANGYESGKITPNGFLARIKSLPYSYDLMEQIKKFAQNNNYEFKKKKIHFGPIASGEKVIAHSASEEIKRIKSYMEDSLALEMEALGLAEALQLFPYVRGGNIRGISDFASKEKNEMDQAGIQQEAINNAAAFTFDFLRQFDLSQIKENTHTTYPNVPEHFYYITDSNVIQGSEIHVKGDFNVGDLEGDDPAETQ